MALMSLVASFLQADEESFDRSYQSPVGDREANYCCPSLSYGENGFKRFFVEGEVLYWKPHISNLELCYGNTSYAETVIDGVRVISTEENDFDPHFKWNTGYRVGAGYNFDCSNWELASYYTHFKDSGSRKSGDDDFVSRGRSHFKFNQIDLAFCYKSSLFPCFNLKPFLAVRAAEIGHNLRARLVQSITLDTGVATETRRLHDNQCFRGIGPTLGLKGDYDIGCGLSLFGTAAAGILYGQHKLHFHDKVAFTAPFSTQLSGRHTKQLHSFDCNVDLALGVGWDTCLFEKYQLNVKLAFEHHQYFNQSRLGADRGDLSLDGGVFSVGVAF